MAERSLNEHLSHLLAQANRHLSRQLTAEGVSLDQWRLMKVLSESGGLPMGKLAEELALNLPTLTKLVDRMVQEALVYRVPDPNDRRKVRMGRPRRGHHRRVARQGGRRHRNRRPAAAIGLPGRCGQRHVRGHASPGETPARAARRLMARPAPSHPCGRA